MKYKSGVTLLFLTGLLFIASTETAYSAFITKSYADITLSSPNQTTHLDDVWDLTQGDLTLSYTIDMSTVRQPPRPDPSWRPWWWNPAWEPYLGWPESTAWYWSHTLWIEVGMRGVGGSDFNPGPWNTYQGNCGGWMVHDADAYIGEWTGTGWIYDNPNSLDMDDKISLTASAGRDEKDYDVLLSNPNTVLNPTIGSGENYGVWFDRDGVDQWQSTYPGMVDGGNYNTNGIYHIVITYHAINNGLGVMFATINGIPTGFYAPPADWIFPPDYYPAGISFKGDMKQMQVFAGVSASNSDPVLDPAPDYGSVTISSLSVAGYSGTADPLVPGFTYTVTPPYTVHFTDTTHGGMPPYSYNWDFGDGTPVSTAQNPTHTYAGLGSYTVKLTVTPFRCVTKSTDPIVIFISAPVGGEYVPLSIHQLLAPFGISLAALLAIAASFVGIRRVKKR